MIVQTLNAGDCIFDGRRRSAAPPDRLRAFQLRAAGVRRAAALPLPARSWRSRRASKRCARLRSRALPPAAAEDAIRAEVAALIRPLFVSRTLRRPGLRPARVALRRADPHRRRKRRRDGRVRVPETAAARSEPARCARRVPALRSRSRAVLRHLTSTDDHREDCHERRSVPQHLRPRAALQRSATAAGPHRHRCRLERAGRPDALPRRTPGARHHRRLRRADGRGGLSRSSPRRTRSRCMRSTPTSHGSSPRTACCSRPSTAARTGAWSTCRPVRICARCSRWAAPAGRSATAARCAARPTRAQAGRRRTPAP